MEIPKLDKGHFTYFKISCYCMKGNPSVYGNTN